MLDNGGPPGQQMGAAAHWRAVTRVLRSTAATLHADLLNTFFPSDCRVCGLPMTTASPALVCEACVAGVHAQASRDPAALCSRCGETLALESLRFARSLGVTECTLCRLAPPAFARAVAFADYDGETRELLHLLKFSAMRATAEHILGARLADAITRLEPHLALSLLVIPVPLHAARHAQRGYNQSELLAHAALQHLARTSFRPKLTLVPDALIRVKPTPPFYSLSPTQRRARIRGAFALGHADKILNRDVLLIDDILTTGATASECARVLRHAGAANVWVATVARAQREPNLNLNQNLEPNNIHPDIAIWDTSPKTTSANIH